MSKSPAHMTGYTTVSEYDVDTVGVCVNITLLPLKHHKQINRTVQRKWPGE